MSRDGTAETLAGARAAFRRRDWVAARAGFTAAQQEQPLGAEDLHALADCAWWLGEPGVATTIQQEAYRGFLADDQRPAAALVALEIGYTLSIRGEDAAASGWVSRAARLLDGEPECAGHGYLRYIDFEVGLAAADLDGASEAAEEVHALGRRTGDPSLTALGVLGQGRVAIKRRELTAGLALLDEAMVAAISDELDPAWAGNIYCHLMSACYEIADLRRASEWTEATARWCEQMPGAGPFMGVCRVHRAQVLRVRGAWDEAEREVVRVCDELADFDVEMVAEAHYEHGELRRLRGDLDGAEAAFRAGHRFGRDPHPGLALLRLERGETEVAEAGIRAALAAAEPDPLARAALLPAAVEIALASDDLDGAKVASAELATLADDYGTQGFEAAALQAQGLVLLAEERAELALPAVRGALRAWQELGAPYEVARVRLQLARAYEGVGDHEAAGLERQAAGDELSRLGVPHTRAGGAADVRPTDPAGLTPREAEVLGMVATGRTNQQIATDLVLSVRTVERHLATVYQKLGLRGRSARAAAVSYAHRNGLAPS